VLNVGYRQQQNEAYIDESKVDFSCSECDYKNDDEFINIKEWYKKLLILSVGDYSISAWIEYKNMPGGVAIAETSCVCSDKTDSLSIAITRWYKNGIWDSNGSCCNYVAKIHEEVHQRQCADLGWEKYQIATHDSLWTTLEKPAYMKTVDEIKNIFNIMKKIRGL